MLGFRAILAPCACDRSHPYQLPSCEVAGLSHRKRASPWRSSNECRRRAARCGTRCRSRSGSRRPGKPPDSQGPRSTHRREPAFGMPRMYRRRCQALEPCESVRDDRTTTRHSFAGSIPRHPSSRLPAPVQAFFAGSEGALEPCFSVTSRKTRTAPTIPPCSFLIGAGGIVDGSLELVSGDQEPVARLGDRRCLPAAPWRPGFPAVFLVDMSMMWNTS